MSKAEDITKRVYNDPLVVAEYVEVHARNPKLYGMIDRFAPRIPGKRLIDIGCGPGQDSYRFAQLGFKVTGVDYSEAMIRAAKGLMETDLKPTFLVGDMRQIGNMFGKDNFDGAWVSACLLHIPQEDVGQVLGGIVNIVKPGGMVYFGMKGGVQGARLVEEDKYGKRIKREFVFWERENFEKLLAEYGYDVMEFEESKGGRTGDEETTWLNFFCKLKPPDRFVVRRAAGGQGGEKREGARSGRDQGPHNG